MQIIIKLTNQCNFSCVYCSEGNPTIRKFIEMDTLKKMVDDVPEILENTHDDMIELLWHGGEPLLYGLDNLSEIMQYATQKLAKYKLKFLLQTNGYLIDKSWINLFKQFDVNVGISLDGYEEIHDFNRKTIGGEKTFWKIISNIEALKVEGIMPATLMVLNTDINIDSDKLFKFIEEKDLQTKIHPVIPCGRAENVTGIVDIYDKYVLLMQDLYAKCMDSEKTVVIEPLDQIVNAILGIAPIKECSYNGVCGRQFICLYSDGGVGFCGRASNGNDIGYGKLSEKSLWELYNSQNAKLIRSRDEYLQKNDCMGCTYWDLCHGGCSFEAFLIKGDIYSKYHNCVGRKKLIDFLRKTGIELLRKRFLREKNEYRAIIKEKKLLLEEINNA